MAADFLPQNRYQVAQPAWSENAVIYQVNTRQFSAEGNFQGVIKGLEHIKALGADIIYLMPVQPIGIKNRKGALGSPYSVKDYFAINPEFGDENSFAALVSEIHRLDMKVILDWVANHSAWDNPFTVSHPDWYAKDYQGNFRPSPWWDWEDIIEFDYSVPALRRYMTEAMCYWVERFDIDGFRCDVAGYVPNDFWAQARAALDAIKPIFMLAEWENRDLHEQAFNMTYAWSWNEAMHDIAQGRAPLDRLRKYYSWNERSWPESAYRMTFVSNHDKNAWDGTQHEQFGQALEAAIVLSVTGEGMPLIHNGQEAGENKRLAFFERDPIDWQDHAIGDLYRELISLKKRVKALWNGKAGATMLQVNSNDLKRVFSYVRMQGNEKILVVLNLSPDTVSPTFDAGLYNGQYRDVLNRQDIVLDAAQPPILAPWAYRVYEAI